MAPLHYPLDPVVHKAVVHGIRRIASRLGISPRGIRARVSVRMSAARRTAVARVSAGRGIDVGHSWSHRACGVRCCSEMGAHCVSACDGDLFLEENGEQAHGDWFGHGWSGFLRSSQG